MKYLVAMILFYSSTAYAAVGCSESIDAVILHSNGKVYFKSSKTCDTWCQLNWSDVTQQNRAYSMLLAAKASSEEIEFYWQDIDKCTDKNLVYTSPDYMSYL